MKQNAFEGFKELPKLFIWDGVAFKQTKESCGTPGMLATEVSVQLFL